MDNLVFTLSVLCVVSSNVYGKSLMPPCSQCPPETQTRRQCNATHPPLCSPCPSGFFQAPARPTPPILTCDLCTTCEPGEYAYESCIADRDTVCRRCWYVAHTNSDYMLNCKEYYDHIDKTGLEVYESNSKHIAQKEDSKHIAQEDSKYKTVLYDDVEYEMFGDEPAAANFVDPEFGRKQPEFPQNDDYENFKGLEEEGLLRKGVEHDGSGDEAGFQIRVPSEDPEDMSSGEVPGWVPDSAFTTSDYHGTKDRDSTGTKDRDSTGAKADGEGEGQQKEVVEEIIEESTVLMVGNKGADVNEGAMTASEAVPVAGIVIAAVTAGIVCFFVGFFINNVRCLCLDKGKKKGDYMATSTIDDTGTFKHQTELDVLNHNGNKQQQTSLGPSPGRDVMSAPIIEQDEEPPASSTDSLLQETLAGVGTFLQDRYQSPVDVKPEEVETDATLEKHPLTCHFACSKPVTITNTGTTVKLSLEPGSGCELRGGPLGDRVYQLDHVHVHWGSSDERGSEHTVAGKQYSAELHLVHWNMTDYGSFTEACRAEGGLAVLAVLLQVGEEHQALAALTDRLPNVQYKGEAVQVEGDALDFVGMLPEKMDDYWTYTGSLTLPPYHENVTWLLFKQVMDLAPEQIQEFRQLMTYERDESHVMNRRSTAFLVDNYRNTMPLEGRVIRASFV